MKDTCENCGYAEWVVTATRMECKDCGALWGSVNGQWALGEAGRKRTSEENGAKVRHMTNLELFEAATSGYGDPTFTERDDYWHQSFMEELERRLRRIGFLPDLLPQTPDPEGGI